VFDVREFPFAYYSNVEKGKVTIICKGGNEMKELKIVIKEWLKSKKACVYLVAYIITSVIYMIVNASILKMLSNAINEGMVNMMKNMILIGTACIVNTILGSLESMFNHYAIHIFYTESVDRYSNKILDADYQLFLDASCSKIVTLMEQIWKISKSGLEIARVINAIVNIGVLLYFIYTLAPSMILPIMVIYLIGGLLIKRMFSLELKYDNEADILKRKRNHEIYETINGFVEVRSFCTQERHKKSISDTNMRTFFKKTMRTKANVGLSFFVEFIGGLGTVLGLWFTLTSVENGSFLITDGIVLITYIWRLSDPLTDAIVIAGDISETLSSMIAYGELINYKNQTVDTGKIELSEFNDSIEFDNVGFSYNDSNGILNNLSIKIKKGEKIGLCGKSGGGKTTLFKLLQKFYVPDSGTIRIDGIDYLDIRGDSFRRKIGVVHQDPYIFNGTIYENVRYGNPDAGEYEVIEACKKANIYDFILSLKNRLNTEVGPKGLKLSGGQKQRIALARMFLINPEIILLDEATSALDNESETLIQEVLSEYNDRTIITIAHRLSTIKDSDRIYVIENGTVAEEGTHEELLKKGGIYQSLHK